MPLNRNTYLTLGLGLYASIAVALGAGAVPRSKTMTGQQIFVSRCASCHGSKGEGTKRYAKPLVGNQSAPQLAKFIARSMPPAPARRCSAPDAQKVASYIYHAFYSPIAQARNQPARIELSRLTVGQYRNAVADLIATFRSPGHWEEQQRGLRGEYFKGRRFEDGERGIDRVDPQVKLDFGQGVPGPEGFEPHTFCIRWSGAVIAPETGDYEFVVHTDQGVQMWVNDMRRPLIDAGVKSGSDTEYRGSIYLLGGRAYPLRLEFSKATQGVDDSDKLKDMPIQKASISLGWKQPKRAEELIPQRWLIPASFPETFAVTAPFPPDDRSIGYERGNTVSKEWDEATTEGALETAAYVASHLRELSGVADDAPDRAAKLREFCARFVERAFRRPLTPDITAVYVDKQFHAAANPDAAVKRVVLLALKSPRFLYREAGTAPDAYDVASRLSFGLWDSLPDQELLKAAAAGQLSTREQVAAQAERMVADSRSRFKVRQFLLQWLKVDEYPDLAKDAKRFPGFDPEVASDLRASLELFLDDVVWSEHSDYRDLLLSDRVFLNGRLAGLYGADLPADAPFQPVLLDGGQRSGVLTHPYLMASFAHVDSTSPIHRGVLVARNMLGRVLQPPPKAFVPIPADLHPNLTTRQRVELQTKSPACVGCHGMINPLGFTLEKFDAIGRFRTAENGKPIDSSGAYQPVAGTPARFSGARDLANYIANSKEAQTAFVQKLFQYEVKQPVRAYGPHTLDGLEQAFAANGFSIRRQLVETMAVSALKR